MATKGEPRMAGATPRIENLAELHNVLRAKLPSRNIFACLNTRLIIQLGVNLEDILPEQNQDPVLLQKVVDTLGRMNIRVEVVGT
jgi:hypothetical protein